MPTPLSNLTSYATQADMLKRYDARPLGELVNDIGKRFDPATLVSQIDEFQGGLSLRIGKKWLHETLERADRARLVHARRHRPTSQDQLRDCRSVERDQRRRCLHSAVTFTAGA